MEKKENIRPGQPSSSRVKKPVPLPSSREKAILLQYNDITGIVSRFSLSHFPAFCYFYPSQNCLPPWHSSADVIQVWTGKTGNMELPEAVNLKITSGRMEWDRRKRFWKRRVISAYCCFFCSLSASVHCSAAIHCKTVSVSWKQILIRIGTLREFTIRSVLRSPEFSRFSRNSHRRNRRRHLPLFPFFILSVPFYPLFFTISRTSFFSTGRYAADPFSLRSDIFLTHNKIREKRWKRFTVF